MVQMLIESEVGMTSRETVYRHKTKTSSHDDPICRLEDPEVGCARPPKPSVRDPVMTGRVKPSPGGVRSPARPS